MYQLHLPTVHGIPISYAFQAGSLAVSVWLWVVTIANYQLAMAPCRLPSLHSWG